MIHTLDIDRDVLAAANINPDTGLATDYLNHFNEVAMLIDMLEGMPDMVDEILDWRPISYADHFHATGFREKELAVAAFEAAPSAVRKRFAAACDEVESLILDLQEMLRAQPDDVAAVAARSADIYDLIARVGGVINADIVHPAATDEHEHAQSQAGIDALFD